MKTHLQINIEFETDSPGWSPDAVFNGVADMILLDAQEDSVKISSLSYNAFSEKMLVKPVKRTAKKYLKKSNK
jgi:hypothetical protein